MGASLIMHLTTPQVSRRLCSFHTVGLWGDLVYSSINSVVEVYWSGFVDPESDISYFRVAVGQGLYNPQLREMHVHPEHFLPFTSIGLVQSWRRATFSFPDGTFVVASIEAVNKAGLGTVVSSNGFTIDM